MQKENVNAVKTAREKVTEALKKEVDRNFKEISKNVEIVPVQANNTVIENELQKKANEIELLKKQLEEQLNKIARKNEIANHREVFLEKRREILNAEKFLKTEKGFETNNIKISFLYPNENSRYDGGFAISNKSLILKFIEVLLIEIETKIKEIENELIND
jgi:DNA-directed RNA polymerase specialized sigma subunit